MEEDVNDVLRALLSPKRPYGYVFAFSGGQHKTVRGHYSFFEMDQSRVSSAIQLVNDSSIGPNIFCMCCGLYTPTQREVMVQRSHIDGQIYLALHCWYVKRARHPAFKGLPLPSEAPKPVLLEDPERENIHVESVDVDIENTFEGGTSFFSTPQDPTHEHSVFGSSRTFSVALMKHSDPTLLTSGGSYANMKDICVEDILPFAFPFGIGGPKMNRRTKVLAEACLQRYMNLAMPQFLRGDVILVLNHMYGRQLSYKSGVMTCRSKVDGVSVGEKLATINIEDFQLNELGEYTIRNPSVERMMKAISTSCRALGHTAEADKAARKCCFSMMDHFGVNSLFLTITPCDECSFRVRLYCKPGHSVSIDYVLPR